MGLTYKPNVSDIRNSPAKKIVRLLKRKFKVFSVDPHVEDSYSLEQAIEKAEMVVTLVAHNQFINISTKLPESIIYLDLTGKCK